MGKTLLMLIGLAGVCVAGSACFGVFGPPKDQPVGTTIEECAGLSGEAKEKCEQEHGK